MGKRWIELTLSLSAVALLSIGFVKVIRSGLDDNSLFEAKLAAGTVFSQVAFNFSLPKYCRQEILPVMPKWVEGQGLGEFEWKGHHITVRPSPRRPPSENVTMAEAEIATPPMGSRKITLMLKKDPSGKILDCMMDYESVYLEVGATAVQTPRCVPPPRTALWYLRCPQGWWLNRYINAEHTCCPIEAS